MATLMNTQVGTTDTRAFQVIHPLDDIAEEKCSPDRLGEMPLTGSTKLSLYALRGYLFSMGLLVAYRLLTLAGALGHHSH